jgi:DNA-binding GntR family transcriptional regulator
VTSENRWTSSSLAYIAPTAAGEDAWSQEATAQGATGTQTLRFAGVASAPSVVVEALRLQATGGLAVVRQRVIHLDGIPVELADTYYPMAIAEGTALQEARRIRGGAVALLAELGYAVAHVREDVTARMPTHDEVTELSLAADEPVILLERVSFAADDTPIQADVMVAPARLHRLRYELKVT